MGYITAIDKLKSFALGHVEPSAGEIQTVMQILAQNPVVTYPPFDIEEIRLVGIYREALNPRLVSGRVDEVWDDIGRGEWYAWLYAVHEAAELQVFADLDANPFDPVVWRRFWKLPHLHATVFELQYLRNWARQLGIEVSELAIEQEHPIRGRYAPHTQHLRDLQLLQRWPAPTDADLQAAIHFWQQIRAR